MAFTLPDLPYAYDALGDYMSAETLEYHHDKHHKAYVDNGNKLAEEAGMSDKTLEEVVVASFGTNAGLFNNAAQHYNHIHFWNWMKGGGGGNNLPGKLAAAVDSDLGGYDQMRADFKVMKAVADFTRVSPSVRQQTLLKFLDGLRKVSSIRQSPNLFPSTTFFIILFTCFSS